MDDSEFHRQMADLYAQQGRTPAASRPEGITVQEWKNRHLVSAKLSANLYAELVAFCRRNNFSINTGLKAILSHHFNKTNG
jgi:hypothetical protein